MRSARFVVLISLLSACSSDDTPATRSPAADGGPGGAASGAGGAAGNVATGGASGASGGAGGRGTGGSLTDVPCGNAICKPIADPSVESNACCTADTKCGYRLPIASACLGTNQFGTVTTACVGYSVQGKVQYPGCCSPT